MEIIISLAEIRAKLANIIDPRHKTYEFPFFWGGVMPSNFQYPQTKMTFQYLRSLSKSPIPRRAINAIKKQVASLEWTVATRKGIRDKKRHQDDIKRITEWFMFPNADDSLRTLLEMIIEDILVLDAGAIEVQINNNRPWLWPVDGSSILLYPDGGYAQQVGGEYINLSKDELIYIMSNPSTGTPFGLSPLEVAAQNIEWFLGAQAYAGRTAANASPKKLLDLGRSADPNHVQSFRRYWQNEVAGKGITPIMGGTDRIAAVDVAPSDDQGLYLQWQNFLIRVIALAFDLSPQKLGQLKDVNRSTAETESEATDEEAVKPLAKLIADYFNRKIIWRMGYTDLEFRFNFIISANDKQANALALRNLAEADIVTMDEARAEVGLPPLEDENLGKLTLTAYRREIGGVNRQPGDPGRPMSNTPLPQEARGGDNNGSRGSQINPETAGQIT